MDKDLNENAIYLAGVIGNPIAHSKSPKLHNYWLSKYKINGFYIPFSVSSDSVELMLRYPIKQMYFRSQTP